MEKLVSENDTVKVAVAIHNLKFDKNKISMLRTAEHFGIRRAFVIGKKIKYGKACMNCHRHMLLKYFRTEEDFIEYLKEQEYNLVIIEKTEGSKNMNKYEFPDNVVLMTGHEVMGFSEKLLSIAYDKVHISNVGLVNCMNTSAAFAIGCYKWFEQKVLA